MTPRCHGSKISGSRQSLLTGTATCIVERWKKRMGFFSSAICAGPRFAGIQKFCYHGPLTQRFRLSIEAEIENDPNDASAVVSSWLRAWTLFISS